MPSGGRHHPAPQEQPVNHNPLRAVVVRENDDGLLVLKPTDHEVQQFGTGANVQVQQPFAVPPMAPRADIFELYGQPVYDKHGYYIGDVTGAEIHIDRDTVDVTTFGGVDRTFHVGQPMRTARLRLIIP